MLHAEAKDTSRGPRLLEMNARLGGGVIEDIHQPRDRRVDLVEQQLLLAVGLPAAPTPYPRVRRTASPPCSCTRLRSGTLTDTRFLDHLAGDPSVIQRDVLVDAGRADDAAADGFPTVIAELTVYAETPPTAVAKALAHGRRRSRSRTPVEPA